MHYVFAGVLIILALGALFGVGYGVGLGMATIGLGSSGAILWVEGLMVLIVFLTFNRWFRGWVGANPMLATASASGFTALTALAHWYETGSRVGLWIGVGAGIIAVIAFIKHSCRWGNWCRHVGPWWKNTAWPAIKRGWRQAWGWSRVVVRRYVVPFIVGMLQAFRPWVESNFWLLLSIGFGIGAYFLHDESRDWEQSKWFWLLAGASFVAFMAWSPFTRHLISRLVRWVIKLFEASVQWMWARFSKETSDFGKALTGAVAVLGLAIVSSLIQEVFHRNSGWMFQWLHINMYSHGRVTWGGVALVAGVFTVAVIVLMLILPDLWPKTKPATPVAPARPVPPNNAARAAAAERHARRAARQARIDFLRANP